MNRVGGELTAPIPHTTGRTQRIRRFPLPIQKVLSPVKVRFRSDAVGPCCSPML